MNHSDANVSYGGVQFSKQLKTTISTIYICFKFPLKENWIAASKIIKSRHDLLNVTCAQCSPDWSVFLSVRKQAFAALPLRNLFLVVNSSYLLLSGLDLKRNEVRFELKFSPRWWMELVKKVLNLHCVYWVWCVECVVGNQHSKGPRSNCSGVGAGGKHETEIEPGLHAC